MKVRVDGMGNVKVSDRHKKRLAKLKRDWGAEAIILSPFRKDNVGNFTAIDVRVMYTRHTAIRMPIIK